MSILTDAQKSQLYGRLLGLDSTSNPVQAAVPERVAPTGTVVDREPATLSGGITSNKTFMLVGGLLAVFGIVFIARKVL